MTPDPKLQKCNTSSTLSSSVESKEKVPDPTSRSLIESLDAAAAGWGVWFYVDRHQQKKLNMWIPGCQGEDDALPDTLPDPSPMEEEPAAISQKTTLTFSPGVMEEMAVVALVDED